MLQFFIILFLCVARGSLAGYPDSALGNDIGGTDGFGYGYSGSFSGLGNPPNTFQFPHFDFSNFVSSFQKFQQDLQKKGTGAVAFAYASSSAGGGAHAFSSITQSKNSILANTQGVQNAIQTRSNFPGVATAGGGVTGDSGGYGTGFSSNGQSFGGAFSGSFPGVQGFQIPAGTDGATAYGSVGPGGIQQSAGVFPEIPASPNVNVRFGASDDNPNGFRSVFTSSSSYSTNVDGQPKTVKQATTTVNDNGKITTYTAKSP